MSKKIKVENQESNKYYGSDYSYILAYVDGDGSEVRDTLYITSEEEFNRVLKETREEFTEVEIFTDEFADYHGLGYPESEDDGEW